MDLEHAALQTGQVGDLKDGRGGWQDLAIEQEGEVGCLIAGGFCWCCCCLRIAMATNDSPVASKIQCWQKLYGRDLSTQESMNSPISKAPLIYLVG